MVEQKWTDEVELCHCSRPTVKEHHRDYNVCMNPETCDEEHFSRGMCKTCDMVRCDAFPGSCKPHVSFIGEPNV